MFCSNFAPHQTAYDEKNISRRVLSQDDVWKEKFLNMPERPPPQSNKPSYEKYLSEECWSQIRYSKFYANDYKTFQKITAKPFIKAQQ